ncbi:MAG: aminotransferase class IV [Candidatus Marinimicrobia bacterium]|nr:aminotransferase class IV [Candidatus Neomarinimicrobiota bacterium]MBT3937457.1 aminotransferase class IV [Candidatus Neomarinimicrobiota bacterium]MBT3961313.1 aminotransferase class IV [Candidatus Neomarinimicrobiota bacterium]MBT4383108.1 aminotransferase class IV [Candidatus Neomarinimicrobiota bacterium]MBT4635578.1 aminotransferase class IV [Candidatus Neomarinimicrobiota bacterium]
MTKGTHNYLEDKRNEGILIYVNGDILPRNDATISVFDSGFLLGDGVWEGIRLYNGHLVFLEEHLDRLYKGAKQLAIEVGYNPEELAGLIYKTLAANGMKSGVHIRLIVSRGLKKTPYQHPNANAGSSTIVIIPEYKEADKKTNKTGIRLVTVTTRRGTPDSQDPRLNTLSKLNCIIACIEADKAGADEGIMLDVNGNVSTCNSTNFFIVRAGEVWTSTGQHCLPGVTRQAIINICRDNEIPVYEKDFRIDSVLSADEVFVTGTFAGVIPAIEVDGRVMSNNIRGSLTQRLQKLYTSKLNRMYLKTGPA